jgi:hypothetical protein
MSRTAAPAWVSMLWRSRSATSAACSWVEPGRMKQNSSPP